MQNFSLLKTRKPLFSSCFLAKPVILTQTTADAVWQMLYPVLCCPESSLQNTVECWTCEPDPDDGLSLLGISCFVLCSAFAEGQLWVVWPAMGNLPPISFILPLVISLIFWLSPLSEQSSAKWTEIFTHEWSYRYNLPPWYPRASPFSLGAILNYQCYIEAMQLPNNFNECTIRETLGQIRPGAPDVIPVKTRSCFNIQHQFRLCTLVTIKSAGNNI